MNDHIESLARQKDFFQLSPAERTAVLSEMTEEEYEQLRLTLSTLRGMDADAQPSPLLRERLLRHMAEIARPRLPWHQRPVPMWQAAAAAVLAGAVVAACFFPKKSPHPVEPADGGRETVDGGRQSADGRRAAVQVQHDTVWLTQVAYRYHTVYRPCPETVAEKPLEKPVQAWLERPIAPDVTMADSLTQPHFALPAAPTGTPMSALPELMQFLGGEKKM